MKIRNTKQKELLHKELENMRDFFSADDFHLQILKKMPNIGIATIYRFLNEKVKNNQLHSYYCDKRAVYSNSKKQSLSLHLSKMW